MSNFESLTGSESSLMHHLDSLVVDCKTDSLKYNWQPALRCRPSLVQISGLSRLSLCTEFRFKCIERQQLLPPRPTAKQQVWRW